jgi:flagellar hook assembly protein FlgD
MTIYKILGEKVKTLLADAAKPAGFHAVVWNGLDDKDRAVASGIYVYRLSASGQMWTKKMVMMR